MAEAIDDSVLSLIWTDHQEVLRRVITTLRNKDHYADVTLVCGRRHFAAHKFVLAMCSSYFEELFECTPSKHPIIVLTGVPMEVLERLLDFMYLGQTDVHDKDIDRLLQVAQEFKIRGLMKTTDFPENQVNQTMLYNIKQEPVDADFSKSYDAPESMEKMQSGSDRMSDFHSMSNSIDGHLNAQTRTYSKGIGSNYSTREEKGKTEIRCPQCETCFESLAALNHHRVSHIEDKFFSCFDCPYKTLNYNDYKMHISKHIKVRPFACPYCQERQINKELHISHQQRQHPGKEVVITETESLFEIIRVKQENDQHPVSSCQEPHSKVVSTTITLPREPPSWNLAVNNKQMQRKPKARAQSKKMTSTMTSRTARGRVTKTTKVTSR